MEKSRLIDLFGLNTDSSDSHRLDNLLFHLELETVTCAEPENFVFDQETQGMDGFIII
jgi:hypothetical protein